MKNLLPLFLLLFANITIAQTTAIPDANFEQALINLGLDNGSPDGVTFTANIDTVTHLDVSNNMIFDLTGIEAFTALINLNCSYNLLSNLSLTQNTALTNLICLSNGITNLDITQNVSLTYLDCAFNLFLSLDVSQNTGLEVLACGNPNLNSLNVSQNTNLTTLSFSGSQITNIDLTQNTSLIELYSMDNQLINLDISQNTALNKLGCYGNQLTCLNLKNGNNINFTYFSANNNPNLTCIEVDDVAYSTTNWTNIDPASSFSTNCGFFGCSTVSINDLERPFNLVLYPNPVSHQLSIDTELKLSKITIIDITGKIIMTTKGNTNTINVADLSDGIYFIQLITEERTLTKKFVKQ